MAEALGIFAGTIGTRRLLKLFAKYDIKTTFFIPGHSLETFPEESAMVRDAGHEMCNHAELQATHANKVIAVFMAIRMKTQRT